MSMHLNLKGNIKGLVVRLLQDFLNIVHFNQINLDRQKSLMFFAFISRSKFIIFKTFSKQILESQLLGCFRKERENKERL